MIWVWYLIVEIYYIPPVVELGGVVAAVEETGSGSMESNTDLNAANAESIADCLGSPANEDFNVSNALDTLVISLALQNPSAWIALVTMSFAKKNVKKKRINGSKTRIQEMLLNPLEHNQFKIHPQAKTKIPFVTKVMIWKLLKNAESKLIPAKTKYNCAGVQKRLKSVGAIIY